MIRNKSIVIICHDDCISLEKFEDTKGVIRSRESKKDMQNNGHNTVPLLSANDCCNTTNLYSQ
jgi:hypothetical protein